MQLVQVASKHRIISCCHVLFCPDVLLFCPDGPLLPRCSPVLPRCPPSLAPPSTVPLQIPLDLQGLQWTSLPLPLPLQVLSWRDVLGAGTGTPTSWRDVLGAGRRYIHIFKVVVVCSCMDGCLCIAHISRTHSLMYIAMIAVQSYGCVPAEPLKRFSAGYRLWAMTKLAAAV